MLNKNDAFRLINKALENGVDYADFFLEKTNSIVISARSGKVRNAVSDNITGFGIRLIKGEDVVYGYENGFNLERFEKLLDNLKQSFNGLKNAPKTFALEKEFPLKSKIKISNLNPENVRDFLIGLTNKIKAKNNLIIESEARLSMTEQEVLIINSNGVYQHDFRPYTRLFFSATSKSETSNQMENSYRIVSKQGGYELIEETKFDKLIDEITDVAVKLLTAEKVKPGKMPVIIENGFGGVIFHEACGHPLEASAIARGLSPFVGKIGEQIASPILTAYDDGTINNAWGQITVDDEGNTPTKNLLIENGILKNYMVDFYNGRKLKMAPTGCGRRQSYKFAPTSRMTSTFIAPGKSKIADLFKDVKLGLYAKALGGGQVSPTTGEFNFGATEAYYVRDGKIAELVKGAMLIGYGHQILKEIDMIADNVKLGEGMCGASSGSIPVDVGQPTIRVQNLIIGGGKND